jgi:hypothetical protein
MKNISHLENSILHKVSRMEDNRWCGYLRHDEIEWLSSKIDYDVYLDMTIREATVKRKCGCCRSQWFYFSPRKQLRILLEKYHPIKNNI